MAVSGSLSCVISAVSYILIFSGMQMYKSWLGSTQLHAVLGGYLGSILFMLLLTAIGNFESCIFGKNYQVKIFPEIISCFLVAVFSSAIVHRVCATVCMLMSVLQLYYINNYAQQFFVVPTIAAPVQTGRKKK